MPTVPTMGGVVGLQVWFLARLHHHVLAHHAFVLVEQHVAVIHVGVVVIAVLAEQYAQLHRHPGRDCDRVFPPVGVKLYVRVGDLQHLERAVVDVEVVDPVGVAVGHNPGFRVRMVDHHIDPVHVHAFPIDLERIEFEFAFDCGGFDGCRGRGVEHIGGSHVDGDVFPLIGPLDGSRRVPWNRPADGEQVYLFLKLEVEGVFILGHPQVIGVAETAEFHGAGHVGDDFCALPRAQPHAGGLAGSVEQAGVGGDHLEFPAVVKSEVVEAHVGAVE